MVGAAGAPSGIGPWDIKLEKLRGRAGDRLGKRTEAVGTPNRGVDPITPEK